jgi:chemotaxis protein CheD
MTATTEVSPPEVIVEIADFAVARGDSVLVTAGLGSCVALVLHDGSTGIAGLAHILLPTVGTGPASIHPAKYADAVVPMLVEEMRRHGARGRIVAKLAGGARMFAALLSSGINMGQRNIDATRAALRRAGVPVVAEDIGGEFGRSVRVEAASGVVRVRSLAGGNRDL